MTFLKTAAAAAALVILGAGAQAATFDFDDMGDQFEASYTNFAGNGAVSGLLTDGGISITNITATGGTGEYGYLDGGAFSGLGACEVAYATTQDCSSNGDDNLITTETVTVMFDQIVAALSILVNGNHVAYGDGSIDINGDPYTVTGGIVDLTGLLASNSFTFSNPSASAGAYISAMTVVIPVPAAGFLLLGGLGGLMALRRRRKS